MTDDDRKPGEFDQERLTPEAKLEKWGPGPWVSEPDSVDFEAHGMACHMLRHPVLGVWCGYVEVPRSHPLHGLRYDDDLVREIDVHGGLTYAGEYGRVFGGAASDTAWCFGFDCGHLWDLMPYAQPLRDDLDLPSPMLGGDTDDVYRDLQYVHAQCEALAAQLAALGVTKEPKP